MQNQVNGMPDTEINDDEAERALAKAERSFGKEDARVALFGFIRGELISSYFQFLNLMNLNIDPDKKLNYLKISLGEISAPDKSIIDMLTSHLRRNFTNNIYSLLESGHRKFYTKGRFNDYLLQFDTTLVNGFKILRHIRNCMHNNGLFLPTDKKDFSCNYRGYKVNYKYGDFVTTNYMFIYWIITDSFRLFSQMTINNLKENPTFLPIDQNYNIVKSK